MPRLGIVWLVVAVGAATLAACERDFTGPDSGRLDAASTNTGTIIALGPGGGTIEIDPESGGGTIDFIETPPSGATVGSRVTFDIDDFSNPRSPVAVNLQLLVVAPPVPATQDDCKNGGWQSRARADGSSFKNQGDCIQYVNTGK